MTTLAASAPKGRLETLTTLRDRLASDIDECESARDVAALSQRLMDVLEQIAGIEKSAPAQKGTPLDEFTRRRQEQEASGSPRTAKRAQRG